MDTPTVVPYNSKVQLLFSIIIFNTCDEWILHHDMCSMSFTEVLIWIKEGCGSCMERMDYETLGLGMKSMCSLRFHRVPSLLVV
jgi:hypothetical protein